MDSKTIEYGLKNIHKDCIAEALIHPCKYDNTNTLTPTPDSHHFEYLITQDNALRDKFTEFGFDLVNHSSVLEE